MKTQGLSVTLACWDEPFYNADRNDQQYRKRYARKHSGFHIIICILRKDADDARANRRSHISAHSKQGKQGCPPPRGFGLKKC